MDTKSLIDKIVQDVPAGCSCKVYIRDDSEGGLFYGDEEVNKTKEPESTDDYQIFKNNDIRSDRPNFQDCYRYCLFPVTTYMLKMAWWFLRVIIWYLYRVADKIWYLVTGDKRKEGFEYSKRLNIFIFITTLVTLIVVLVAWIIFLVRSVMFLSPESNVNDEGAVSIKQPCGKEHFFYIYNTAQSWANTGIEILEGDKVEICSSGSYYSNIVDLYDAAKNNEKPRYMPTKNKAFEAREDSLVQTLAVYRQTRTGRDIDNPRFGHLLFTIRNDGNWDYDDQEVQSKIFQAKRENNSTYWRDFIAPDAGRLYVSINDIYLSNEVRDTLLNNRKLFDMVIPTTDSTYLSDRGKLNEMAKNRPEFWFDDNVGEILVNVTITRKNYVENNFLSTIYGKLFRSVDKCLLGYVVLALLAFLFLDYLCRRGYLWFKRRMLGWIVEMRKRMFDRIKKLIQSREQVLN